MAAGLTQRGVRTLTQILVLSGIASIGCDGAFEAGSQQNANPVIETEVIVAAFEPGAITDGQLVVEVPVDSASFLETAKANHDGGLPSDVSLVRVTLTPSLLNSEGVTAWRDLFSEGLVLFFVPNATRVGLPAASVRMPDTGFEEVSMEVLLSPEELVAESDLRGGTFSVRLQGDTSRTADEDFLLYVRVACEFIAM